MSGARQVSRAARQAWRAVRLSGLGRRGPGGRGLGGRRLGERGPGERGPGGQALRLGLAAAILYLNKPIMHFLLTVFDS